APAGRRADRPRLRPAPGPRSGAVDAAVGRVGREGGGRGSGVPLLTGGAAGARRDRLHRRVRPRPVDQPGPCAGRRVGRGVVPPGPGRRLARDTLMHFARTEEQDELASIVASLLDRRSDSAAVRAAMESEAGYDESLWQ